jgi:hypothetical protein
MRDGIIHAVKGDVAVNAGFPGSKFRKGKPIGIIGKMKLVSGHISDPPELSVFSEDIALWR